MARKVYGHVINRDGSIAGRVADMGGASMSSAVSINIDTRRIDALADRFRAIAIRDSGGIVRALNRTATETRTAMTRALVKQTGIKHAVVRRQLTVDNASRGSLTAVIKAKGGFQSLKDTGARQTKKGVSAAPWGKRRVFPGTFIIGRYGGNVYKRTSKKRFPLHKLFGPAIPREFPKDQSKAAFDATVPAVLAKRLEHELSRLLSR